MKEAMRKTIVGALLTVTALVLILLGAHGGDLKEIGNKGSLVCWECIGLGK